jgi:hypothetical protein
MIMISVSHLLSMVLYWFLIKLNARSTPAVFPATACIAAVRWLSLMPEPLSSARSRRLISVCTL